MRKNHVKIIYAASSSVMDTKKYPENSKINPMYLMHFQKILRTSNPALVKDIQIRLCIFKII